jgi:hypothetical protein
VVVWVYAEAVLVPPTVALEVQWGMVYTTTGGNGLARVSERMHTNIQHTSPYDARDAAAHFRVLLPQNSADSQLVVEVAGWLVRDRLRIPCNTGPDKALEGYMDEPMEERESTVQAGLGMSREAQKLTGQLWISTILKKTVPVYASVTRVHHTILDTFLLARCPLSSKLYLGVRQEIA